MKFRTIFGVILLALLFSACAQAPETPGAASPTTTPTPRPTSTPELISAPRFDQSACAFVLPDGYVQGENVTCGYLVVPENRSQLPSRAIRLAVGIFHPEGGAAYADPIVYLSGGPGGSALEPIRYQFGDVFEQVLESAQRDLILFDQRGIGRSEPALDCSNFDAVSLDLLDGEIDGRSIDDEEAVDLLRSALESCAVDLDQAADLSAYNSAASAADVHDLRRALGLDQVNLWGTSYGTRLALTVMRDQPKGVRSVVLDSVYPPDVDLYLAAPANFERSLNLLFERCAANPVCDETCPRLQETFYNTVERLNTHPASSTITNPLTGQVYTTTVRGDTLSSFVFQVLYETEFKYLLPQIIHDASQDDFATMNRLRGAMLSQMTLSSRGMMFSVQCNEEIPFSSLNEYERMLANYPKLTGLYDRSILGALAYQVCETWDSGQAPAVENQPVTSDIATLVLAGEFDPITPPAWSQHAAETLTNSFFYIYPGVGHGASTQECGRDMMLDFIDDPATAPDDSCIPSK